MKKFLIMMMCVIMVVCFMPTVAMAAEGENPTTIDVRDFEGLKTALTGAADANSGDTTINITADIAVPAGQNWSAVNIEGYHGADIITIHGNGHKITGLNAPLFSGGFAGGSGLVIDRLTIEAANIADSTNNLGIGAFISCVDSMDIISLTECHLVNSTINSTGKARVGGLIGWTAGYNNPNDGPVDTYINVTNCSVENTNITAAGSVGAIIGHAGNNPATYHTIQGCTVTGCTLKSTDDDGWRVGVVVGTANVGQVTIANITENNNTLTQPSANSAKPEGESNLYGRFVPFSTGVLVINGNVIEGNVNFDPVAMVDGVYYGTLADAISASRDGDTITMLKDCETTDTYTLTSPLTLNKSNVTLDLNGKILTVTNNFSFVINGDRDVVKNGTIQAGSNSVKTTGINSYALVLNGCDGAVVENVTSHGGISVGGSTGETPNAAAATNAVIKDCNITSGDYYAICAQQNSTVTIESGIYTADTRSTLAGVLQGTFIGTDGPKGTITVTGGTFNGAIKNNNNGDLVFKGGTFSIDPTAYKSDLECYTVVKNTTEPETWTVTAGHTWNDGVVTTEPTYDETGEKTYTCTIVGCGSTKTEIIPKKDRPSIPTTPTTPTNNVTNSGTSGTDNATTSADLGGSTSTSNGTTTSTVDKTTADKIVDKAVENKSTEVVIDATANTTTAADSTTIAQVTIPTETLGAIAEKTDADVTIKTDVAEVKLDNAAAAAVSEQAEGDTVQIIAEKVAEDTDKVEFELKVVCSNGKVISNFNGGNIAVTVALPKAMADKKVVCVYIDDNGHMSKVEGQKNADGTYTFVTGHFSSYAILAEEEADAVIAAQKEAIKNIKIKLTSKQVTTKAGKKAVKVTWTADAGDKVLDGVEVFRSTERYKGYGTEPFYTSTKGGNTGSYLNTKSLKKGTRYYYRVRGYVLVDGQKVYTDYSTKAWRTVK